jgi:hypothetical protein
LAPQRQCQQPHQGRPDQERVPEQQKNGDGDVAFSQEIWPHSSDWKPTHQLMPNQNKKLMLSSVVKVSSTGTVMITNRKERK